MKAALIIIFSLVLSLVSNAQIVDFKREDPYKKVFEVTDDFDTSYLTILEAAWERVADNPIGLSMLNDLAYYWHTRNLNTSLVFTQKGLELCAACLNGDTVHAPTTPR